MINKLSMGNLSRAARQLPQRDRQIRIRSWEKQRVQPEACVHLTPREKQILCWIGEDLNTRQIAEKLKVSRKTVEFHRHALRTKLGGVAAMVRYGIKAGLLRL